MLLMLAPFDHSLFLLINHDLSFPFLDRWMPIITDFHQTPLFLALIVPMILGYMIYRERQKGLFFILGLLLAVGIADATSYRLIKQNVERDRPEMADLKPILRVASHSGHSFPSNHAANVFAAAIFTGFLFSRLGMVLIIFATLVAFSRVYVGVHFPLDVMAGAFVGTMAAALCWKLFQMGENFVVQKMLESEQALADLRRESTIVTGDGVRKVWTNSQGIVTGDVRKEDFKAIPKKTKKDSAIILESNDQAPPEEIAIGDLGGLEESEKIKK